MPTPTACHPVARRRTARILALLLATSMLGACNMADRLQNVGKAPDLSPIQDPKAVPGYQPVVMPMPEPLPQDHADNSLWRAGARAFFKDQRASRIGDILTVLISMNDSANISNQTTRTRANSDNAGLTNFFGLESNVIPHVLPGSNAGSLVNMNSATSNAGTGAIKRSDQITLKVAAEVTQVLPNGNLVIQGTQEVRVNFELRQLLITGIIRPEDISSGNTINYEQIAEARIAYGGKGQLTDVQQPRYGSQIFDILMPW